MFSLARLRKLPNMRLHVVNSGPISSALAFTRAPVAPSRYAHSRCAPPSTMRRGELPRRSDVAACNLSSAIFEYLAIFHNRERRANIVW